MESAIVRKSPDSDRSVLFREEYLSVDGACRKREPDFYQVVVLLLGFIDVDGLLLYTNLCSDVACLLVGVLKQCHIVGGMTTS